MRHPCSECQKEFELTRRQEGHLKRGNGVICPKKKCQMSADRKTNARSRAKNKRPARYYRCPFCGDDFKVTGPQRAHLNRGNTICCRSKKCIERMKEQWRIKNISFSKGKRGRPKKKSYYKTNEGSVSKSQKARIEAAGKCPKYIECLNKAYKNGNQFNCNKCSEKMVDGAWMKTAELKNRNAPEEYPVHLPIAIV